MFERLKSLIGGANIAGATATPKKTVDQMVIEVLDGKWGSGDSRKKKITAAGYNYNAIQKRINEVLPKMKTRKQALQPLWDACKAQVDWQYNAKYNWSKWDGTIKSSKNYGTCITYPNVVAMRCKLITEGKSHVIASSGSPQDSQATLDSFWKGAVKKMASINSKYWSAIKYPKKTLNTLIKEGKVKEGDIIGFLDHDTMYAGKDSKGNLLFNNAGHAAGIYDNNKAGSNRAILNQKQNGYGKKTVLGVFSVNTFIVMTSCTGGTITASNRYMAGQTVTITIKPNANYKVKSIKVDGKVMKVATSYSFAKIDANHVVEVVCEKIAPTPTPKKKTIDELANEVLAGKWGSGETRKKKLVQAGYNYDAVQKRVNEIIAEKEKKKEPKGYTGTIPTLRVKKTNAEVIADTLKWAKWIASDNRFHYGYGTHAHHNGCYFCGTQYMKKRGTPKIVDPDFTYCCNPFVSAAWAHGGCVPTAIKKCQNTKSWDFSEGQGYDTSSLFTKLGKPPVSSLKPGDVLCGDSHVALYIGNGKVIQASGGDDNVRNSKKWNNSISIGTWNGWKRAYRFNGSVNADIVMRHGEVSKRVEQWQNFLDWCYDGAFFKECGDADGCFGDNTLEWTKKFQEQYIGKGQGDGLCGNKTFEAAKKVKK